jgi:hypothetical protein
MISMCPFAHCAGKSSRHPCKQLVVWTRMVCGPKCDKWYEKQFSGYLNGFPSCTYPVTITHPMLCSSLIDVKPWHMPDYSVKIGYIMLIVWQLEFKHITLHIIQCCAMVKYQKSYKPWSSKTWKFQRSGGLQSVMVLPRLDVYPGWPDVKQVMPLQH